jgi:hypothetical protein
MAIDKRLLSKRFASIGSAIALMLLTGVPSFAQRQPIPIETGTSAPGAAPKAQNVISKPGSYVLNKNITNTSKNGQDSVAVTASNVTIDLQGFVISATGSNTGAGINATGQTNVTVRNGIISGFTGPAMIMGDNSNISSVTATGNGSGITCGSGCLVSNSIIQGNIGLGLTFTDTTSGYVGDILQGNNSGGAQVLGGTSLKQNVCDGVAC